MVKIAISWMTKNIHQQNELMMNDDDKQQQREQVVVNDLKEHVAQLVSCNHIHIWMNYELIPTSGCWGEETPLWIHRSRAATLFAILSSI